MHIITYTNRHGTERILKFTAAQISGALSFCKSLQRHHIQYTHVFVD